MAATDIIVWWMTECCPPITAKERGKETQRKGARGWTEHRHWDKSAIKER